MNGWIEAARSVGVLDVAKALGHDARKSGAAWSVYGCPVCDADTRHTKSGDKRGALLVTSDGFGWRCIQCDAAGDAVTLAALELTGDELKGNARAAEVREWFARGFASVDFAAMSSTFAARPRNATAPKWSPPVLTAEEAERAERHAKEAGDTWAECVPVAEVVEVADYLAARNVDPAAVASHGLAMTISTKPTTDLGRAWLAEGRRLVVPLYDVDGRLRELVGRLPAIDTGDRIKSRAPTGAQVRGLMFATRAARLMFATRQWFEGSSRTLTIKEGEIDYLQTALRGLGPEAEAVVGVRSGAWTQGHADRIPAGASVYVYTDNDEQGEKYARGIVDTLSRRGAGARIKTFRAIDHTDHTKPKATP